MEKGIASADVVLIVCSPRLKNRYEMTEDPDLGFGGTFEGAIITQHIYFAQMRNKKFFPILPDAGKPEHIPDKFRGWSNNHHFPSGNAGILKLIEQAGAAHSIGLDTSLESSINIDSGTDAENRIISEKNASIDQSADLLAIDWPAILAPVLQKLEKIFDHPAFKRGISFDLSTHKIPPALERELNKPTDSVGERSINALIAVANLFTQELGEKSGSWSAAERLLIRTRLETAMGCVAHLCVDPRSRQTLSARSDQTLDIAAKSIPGATLPLRAEPEKSLVRDLDGNRIPIMRDRHAISLIEGGELKPAQDDLTRAMAAHFSEIGAVPPQVNAALIEQIEGLAYNEKQMGRERFLVFGQGATALPASEICNWINNQLGLRVLNITGQSGDLYLFAENKLLARLQGFFKLFEQAEWKTP
jgi:hypothetical protein